MSLKTRVTYGEEVLNELYSVRGRDEKIDIREIYLQLDAIVNELAKKGFLENMQMGFGSSVDDQFVTSFEWLTVTDPSNNGLSYIAIPANYANLPKNQGIQEVYFQNDFSARKKKYYDPVIITSFKDRSTYRNSHANNLEGRISCFPKGGSLYFDRGGVNNTYGPIGMRLVIRDSGAISDSAPYPIPADLEREVIMKVVDWFRNRRQQPVDLIKDNNDKP